MLITTGNDAQYNMMTSSWGGLGHMYTNKPGCFLLYQPDARYNYQLMENNDTYTFEFLHRNVSGLSSTIAVQTVEETKTK